MLDRLSLNYYCLLSNNLERYVSTSLKYPYEVYYDADTIFDDDFDSQQAGWKKITSQ